MAVGVSEITCTDYLTKLITIYSSKIEIHNILHYPAPGSGTESKVPDFPLVI
jgi:hypothetical protein